MTRAKEGLGGKAAKKMGKVTVDERPCLSGVQNGARWRILKQRASRSVARTTLKSKSRLQRSLHSIFEDMNRLKFFDNTEPRTAGLPRYPCHQPGGAHPYVGNWWRPDTHRLRTHFVHTIADFVNACTTASRCTDLRRRSAQRSRPRGGRGVRSKREWVRCSRG